MEKFQVLDTHYDRKKNKYFIEAIVLEDGKTFGRMKRIGSRPLTLEEIRPYRSGHIYESIPL